MGIALLVAGGLCTVGGVSPAAGANATQGNQSVALVAANVTVEAGQPRRVDATYRFGTTASGSDPGSNTSIEGTMWRFPDREIGGLRVGVDGSSVTPDVTRDSRHLRVAVPVPGETRDGPVSVRLRYRVDGPAGRLRLPLWVPAVPPPGTDRVVRVRVRLPDGTRTQSTTFPDLGPRREDGGVLATELPQMPGVVVLRYGRGSSGMALDRAVEIVGLGTLAGIGTLCAVRRRRGGKCVD